ncbi:hypothetical protein IWZ03DRAFT_58845 [Phyllosticta citriasiana]|uniref:Uncharacterized protein n=1 Tax=Phyllosticta citriasiana TaxID=595635 RepID=A0ABR1KAY7_9PEZI
MEHPQSIQSEVSGKKGRYKWMCFVCSMCCAVINFVVYLPTCLPLKVLIICLSKCFHALSLSSPYQASLLTTRHCLLLHCIIAERNGRRDSRYTGQSSNQQVNKHQSRTKRTKRKEPTPKKKKKKKKKNRSLHHQVNKSINGRVNRAYHHHHSSSLHSLKKIS